MSLKEIDRRVIIWHIDEEEPNSDVRSFFLLCKAADPSASDYAIVGL